MKNSTPTEIVAAWQEAVNRQDVEAVLALSASEIELVGPRGAARGHQVLRDWVLQAGLELTTQRVFERGNVVVATQHGVWRSVETQDIQGEADVATLFRVDNQRVAYLARYDTLEQALAEAGNVKNN